MCSTVDLASNNSFIFVYFNGRVFGTRIASVVCCLSATHVLWLYGRGVTGKLSEEVNRIFRRQSCGTKLDSLTSTHPITQNGVLTVPKYSDEIANW